MKYLKLIPIKSIIILLSTAVLLSVFDLSDNEIAVFFAKPLTGITVGDLCLIVFIIGLINK